MFLVYLFIYLFSIVPSGGREEPHGASRRNAIKGSFVRVRTGMCHPLTRANVPKISFE